MAIKIMVYVVIAVVFSMATLFGISLHRYFIKDGNNQVDRRMWYQSIFHALFSIFLLLLVALGIKAKSEKERKGGKQL